MLPSAASPSTAISCEPSSLSTITHHAGGESTSQLSEARSSSAACFMSCSARGRLRLASQFLRRDWTYQVDWPTGSQRLLNSKGRLAHRDDLLERDRHGTRAPGGGEERSDKAPLALVLRRPRHGAPTSRRERQLAEIIELCDTAVREHLDVLFGDTGIAE